MGGVANSIPLTPKVVPLQEQWNLFLTLKQHVNTTTSAAANSTSPSIGTSPSNAAAVSSPTSPPPVPTAQEALFDALISFENVLPISSSQLGWMQHRRDWISRARSTVNGKRSAFQFLSCLRTMERWLSSSSLSSSWTSSSSPLRENWISSLTSHGALAYGLVKSVPTVSELWTSLVMFAKSMVSGAFQLPEGPLKEPKDLAGLFAALKRLESGIQIQTYAYKFLWVREAFQATISAADPSQTSPRFCSLLLLLSIFILEKCRLPTWHNQAGPWAIQLQEWGGDWRTIKLNTNVEYSPACLLALQARPCALKSFTVEDSKWLDCTVISPSKEVEWVRAILVCPTLTTLHLSASKLSPAAHALLIQGLERNLSISVYSHTNLHLKIGVVECEKYAEMLGRNKGLKTCAVFGPAALAQPGVMDKAVSSLCASLAINQSLTVLHLSCWNLTAAHAGSLFPSLTSSSLTTLNLFSNHLTDAGITPLVEYLSKNPKLTKLNIGSNELTDASAVGLGNVLRENRTLTSMLLEFNQFTTYGAELLKEAIKKNRVIRVILLKNNDSSLTSAAQDPSSPLHSFLQTFTISSVPIGCTHLPTPLSDLFYSGQTNPEGRPHGEGTAFYPNGQPARRGRWVKGEQEGEGEFFFPTVEQTYTGGFKAGKIHGQGKIEGFTRDGKDSFVLSGSFSRNVPDGLAVFINHTQKLRVEGQWVQGKRTHGVEWDLGTGMVTRCGTWELKGGKSEIIRSCPIPLAFLVEKLLIPCPAKDATIIFPDGTFWRGGVTKDFAPAGQGMFLDSEGQPMEQPVSITIAPESDATSVVVRVPPEPLGSPTTKANGASTTSAPPTTQAASTTAPATTGPSTASSTQAAQAASTTTPAASTSPAPVASSSTSPAPAASSSSPISPAPASTPAEMKPQPSATPISPSSAVSPSSPSPPLVKSSSDDSSDSVPDSAFLNRHLSSIVGQTAIKNQLHEFAATQRWERKRRKGGEMKADMHMMFVGPPGTGKTTMASVVGKLLSKLGILHGPLIITDAGALVGKAFGETERLVEAKIKEAEGGVLFIDETYVWSTFHGKHYGPAATKTVMAAMDSGRCVFIFAGYEQEMEEFGKVNEGMIRRVPFRFLFEPYTHQELFEILTIKCERDGLKLVASPSDVGQILNCVVPEQLKEQNGGFVGNWLGAATRVKAMEYANAESMSEADSDTYDLNELTSDHLRQGLQNMRNIDLLSEPLAEGPNNPPLVASRYHWTPETGPTTKERLAQAGEKAKELLRSEEAKKIGKQLATKAFNAISPLGLNI